MEFWGGMAIGAIVGTFLGVFITGLFQMIGRKDDIYERLILEQGGAEHQGEFCEPDNYFNHFMPDRRRSFCPDRRGKPREAGDTDNRVLHYVNGDLGIPKSSGR